MIQGYIDKENMHPNMMNEPLSQSQKHSSKKAALLS